MGRGATGPLSGGISSIQQSLVKLLPAHMYALTDSQEQPDVVQDARRPSLVRPNKRGGTRENTGRPPGSKKSQLPMSVAVLLTEQLTEEQQYFLDFLTKCENTGVVLELSVRALAVSDSSVHSATVTSSRIANRELAVVVCGYPIFQQRAIETGLTETVKATLEQGKRDTREQRDNINITAAQNQLEHLSSRIRVSGPSGPAVSHQQASVETSAVFQVSEEEGRSVEQSDYSSEEEAQEKTRPGPSIFARTASAAASFITGVTAPPAPVSAVSAWNRDKKKRRRTRDQ